MTRRLATRRSAGRQLLQRGPGDPAHQRQLTPVGVYETLARGNKKRKAVRRGRVRSADLGAVCWQLSTMLEGGLTITAALEIIAEDTENLQLREILQQTLAKVSEGKLLSDGFERIPPGVQPAGPGHRDRRGNQRRSGQGRCAPWRSTSTAGTASPRRSAAPSPTRSSS